MAGIEIKPPDECKVDMMEREGEGGDLLQRFKRRDEAERMKTIGFDEMKERFNDHFKKGKRDPRVIKQSDRLLKIMFLLLAASWLYTWILYLAPWLHSGKAHEGMTNEMALYYNKVLCYIIFGEVMSNWLLMYFTRTGYQDTGDRPGLKKKLWEDGEQDQTESQLQKLLGGTQFDEHLAKPLEWFTEWSYCNECEQRKPPRAHHCMVCGVCVLKRDMHCSFVGRCIGHYTQRFFVFWCLWLSIACAVTVPAEVYYLKVEFHEHAEWRDYFFLTAIFKWWEGVIPLHTAIMVVHLYTLSFGALAGFACFFYQTMLIGSGRTTHELIKSKKVPWRPPQDLFRETFGAFWGLNFLLPVNIIFRQDSDGTQWLPDELILRAASKHH